MSAVIKYWTGEEWQQRIQLLLKRHYPMGQYQEVPDTDKGDLGLEGFSRDGCVYQCYAAQEPKTTNQLYSDQRDKITTDIGKFINNRNKLQNLFSTFKISRWIFMVPRFESAQLILHASKKAEEVIAAKLPYVDENFAIVVENDNYFAVEIETLARSRILQINLPSTTLCPTDVSRWAGQTENTSLVDHLERKTEKLPQLGTAQRRSDFKEETIKLFLQGQIALSALYSRYPDIYEDIQNCKAARENLLTISTLVSTGNPSEQLVDAISRYKTDLAQIPGISNQIIDILAFEAISDWLMRCPLDFVGG